MRLILEGLGVDPEGTLGGDPAPRTDGGAGGRADAGCRTTLLEAPGWGLFCQLYELRSARNWGIGDFADLAGSPGSAGAAGADFLGSTRCTRSLPPTPTGAARSRPRTAASSTRSTSRRTSSRRAEPPASWTALQRAEFVDYPAVAAAKLGALRAVFDRDPTRRSSCDDFAGRAARLCGSTRCSRRFRPHGRARATAQAGATGPGSCAIPARPLPATWRAEIAAGHPLSHVAADDRPPAARRRGAGGRATPACGSASTLTSPWARRRTARPPGRARLPPCRA